jgi:hypothetical protein
MYSVDPKFLINIDRRKKKKEKKRKSSRCVTSEPFWPALAKQAVHASVSLPSESEFIPSGWPLEQNA